MTPRTPPPISDGVLREAARRAAARTSMRAVARDVGLSPSGLELAINTSTVWRTNTRRKLTDWFLRQAPGTAQSDAGTVRAALDVLLESVPDDERPAAAGLLLRTVEKLHHDRGRTPPEWIAGLRDE